MSAISTAVSPVRSSLLPAAPPAPAAPSAPAPAAPAAAVTLSLDAQNALGLHKNNLIWGNGPSR